MKTIYEYEIMTYGIETITMPKDANIISVQAQNNQVRLWVETDTNCVESINVVFHMITTGSYIPDYVELEYLGTVVLDDGGFVVHIYKQI